MLHRLPGGFRWLRKNLREDVIVYFKTFADLLEDKMQQAVKVDFEGLLEPDLEYQKFGLQADRLSFSDLLDIVGRELSRQNLAKAVELAERYRLSGMAMNKISKEVKAVRNKNAAHS